jgi:YggT family protein
MGGALLLNFVEFLLIAVWALVVGRMLISWVDPAGRGQVARFLFQVTEPILAPVRRLLPPSRTIDWSGFVVIIVLGLLLRVL